VTLENYQLGYAGVIQLIQIIQNDINFSSILKNLFSLLLFNCYSYEFNNESRGVLFFYSHNFISRRDHLRSFLKVTECIKEKSVVIGITAKRNLALGNLKNIFL
jgi:hypothetical protein